MLGSFRLFAGLAGVCISFFGAHLLISLGFVPAICAIIMLSGLGMASFGFASDKGRCR